MESESNIHLEPQPPTSIHIMSEDGLTLSSSQTSSPPSPEDSKNNNSNFPADRIQNLPSLDSDMIPPPAPQATPVSNRISVPPTGVSLTTYSDSDSASDSSTSFRDSPCPPGVNMLLVPHISSTHSSKGSSIDSSSPSGTFETPPLDQPHGNCQQQESKNASLSRHSLQLSSRNISVVSYDPPPKTPTIQHAPEFYSKGISPANFTPSESLTEEPSEPDTPLERFDRYGFLIEYFDLSH